MGLDMQLQNGGEGNESPTSPTRDAAREPPVLEAYRQFAKSGVILKLCILAICYGAKAPLRFYELINSTRSPQRQAEQPKLRLATPYLDDMYEEQERLKDDQLQNGCSTEDKEVEPVEEKEEIKEVHAAVETDHDYVADIEDDTDYEEEVDDGDEDYIADVGDSEDDEQVVLEATRKRKRKPSRAKRSNNQIEPAPTFEMRDDGTIVVRNGGTESHLPYQPNMVRDMGWGPRSPWEQARRDRMNAACRMSRARAREGATRPYTFRKRAPKKSQDEVEPQVMDIEKQEELKLV